MEKVDDAGEGSEVIITYKINVNTIFDTCKGPTVLGEVENTAVESSPVSDDSVT